MAGDTRRTSVDNGYPRTSLERSSDPPRHSVDEPSRRPSVDESPAMSRSSSKASSTDTNSKNSKPKRPAHYAERKSSISQRASVISQLKNLSLTPSSPINTVIPSPPTSASHALSPAVTNYMPSASKPSSSVRQRSDSLSPTDVETQPESEAIHFSLPPLKQPETEVPRASPVQMYWHQPPMHGMMSTGPARRSHSIAQIGSRIFIIGGSDGKNPKATDSVYLFDAGTILTGNVNVV
jgi:hypothetical protein